MLSCKNLFVQPDIQMTLTFPNWTRTAYYINMNVSFRLSNSSLNNEFFAKACHEWRERLAEGKYH